MAKESENVASPNPTVEDDRTARVIAMVQNALDVHVDTTPTSNSATPQGHAQTTPAKGPERYSNSSRSHGQHSVAGESAELLKYGKEAPESRLLPTATQDFGRNYSPVTEPEKLTNKPVDLTGIVDLSNTEDVDVQTHYAPAVTHETIEVRKQEIRQEQVTREIHHHHVLHRVLPVVDVEVLPSRHFIPVAGGGYKEIPQAQVSDSNRNTVNYVASNLASKLVPHTESPRGARRFTAVNFEGSAGDSKAYTTPEGTQRTETWWVHPPTVETGARDTGQTAAFHFGSENPEDDGIRDELSMKELTTSLPTISVKKSGLESVNQ